MPPRKRARVSQATSPDPEPQQKTPTPSAETPKNNDDEAVFNDPWTDEEEIGLLKGLMRWKPTGIHKHFRLMALHSWLLENQYIDPQNMHTRPPGIWKKLNTLYDLPALDARENARQLSPIRTSDEQEEKDMDDNADVYSLAANKIDNEEFALPLDQDFENMMWKARIADNGEDSELEIPDLNMADEPPVLFTPSFSIEPSEADNTPKVKRGKKSKAKGGAAPVAPRRSSRMTESVKDADEEEPEKSADDDEAASEDHDDDEESQASTPAPKGRGRPKGTATSRGKGRGRVRGK